MLDFPASPTSGQLYNAPNGVTYQWVPTPAMWVAQGTWTLPSPVSGGGVVDVKSYGATGDGVTNDRAAFVAANAAIVSAGGGKVLVPAGAYALSPNFVFAANVAVHMYSGVTFPTGTVRGPMLYWDDYTPTAVGGSVLECQSAITSNEDAVHTLSSLGGIWPEPVKAVFGTSKGYTPADGGSALAYYLGNINYVTTTNTVIDTIAASVDVGHCIANDTRAFGANIIAASSVGTLNVGFVGVEVDVEPSVGSTIAAGSGGVYINAFNVANIGPAIQIDRVAGGSFTNGIVIGGIGSASAAIAMQSTLSCSWGLVFANGTFSQAAIGMGPGKTTRYFDGSTARIADVFTNGSAELVTDHLQGHSVILARDNTQGTPAFAVRSDGGTHSILSYVATGGLWNAGAGTALGVGGNSVTVRSINAWGTLNASGADYAEYEYKRADCGEIAKGDVVGFDENGQLTTVYSQAVSFGVKSTRPNLVGGDDWHVQLGEPPVEPIAPISPSSEPPERTNTIRRVHPDVAASVDADYKAARAKWDADVKAHKAAMYEHSKLKEKFDSEMAEYQHRYEELRQTVDRISYCGKCPVNFKDATPGQYLKAVAGDGDTIAVAVAESKMDDNVIGRVRRVLLDGRPEVAVIVL